MSGVISGFTVIFIVVGAGLSARAHQHSRQHAHEVLSRLVFFIVHRRCCLHSLVTSDLSVVFSSAW